MSGYDFQYMRLRQSLQNINMDSGKIVPGSLVKGKPMMTSSNGNIFRVNGHLCGEFNGLPTQRPVMRSFDVFFDLCLNKRLRKQS